jgi:hypothetical protein
MDAAWERRGMCELAFRVTDMVRIYSRYFCHQYIEVNFYYTLLIHCINNLYCWRPSDIVSCGCGLLVIGSLMQDWEQIFISLPWHLSLFTPWSDTGGVEVELHSFLTSTIHGGQWVAWPLDRITPSETATVPLLDMRLGVTKRESGLFGEQKDLFSLHAFEPRIDDKITRLRAGRSTKLVGLRAEVRNFPVLQHIQNGYGAQTRLTLKGHRGFRRSLIEADRSTLSKPNLRISGAIRPPPYAFIACKVLPHCFLILSTYG